MERDHARTRLSMMHPTSTENQKYKKSGVPPKWLAQQRQLQRTVAIPLTVLEMVSSPTPSTAGNTGNVMGRWRCFSLCWFPKISRGGHGEHFLCPDDPATGEPEVFDLVFDGCNYQVSPSMTRQGKKSGTLIQISSSEKTKSRFSKTVFCYFAFARR